MTRAVRQQAMEDAQVSLTESTPASWPGSHRRSPISVGHKAQGVVQASFRARYNILSVKVWRPDGTLAWTSVEPERMGKKFPVSHHLAEVVGTGEAEAEIEELETAETPRSRRSDSDERSRSTRLSSTAAT